MLEKCCQGTGSPQAEGAGALRARAEQLAEGARESSSSIAKGNSQPDLQMQGDPVPRHPRRAARAAPRWPTSTPHRRTSTSRGASCSAFMVAGEKDRLLTAAQTEQNAELRAGSRQQLGVMGAHDELWTLYQKESTVDVKKQIIQAMFVGGNATRLIELAKTEQNPELRRLAVRNLGADGSQAHGRRAGRDLRQRQGPGDQEGGRSTGCSSEQRRGAGRLARKEQDIDHEEGDRPEAVGDAGSKVATDYLLELLNK